jgi:uncharacterized protein
MTPSPQAESARDAHLFGPGPKRILALDGGGVRGVVSLAFLERIEAAIEEATGKPTRLCDYFDLIGGTSTGAIIATGLALGYRALEIRKFYEKMAPRVFSRTFYRVAGFQSKFDSGRLRRELLEIIGQRTLDSHEILTGLALVMKRLDTGSAWVILNNPRSAFWNTPLDKSFKGNRHIPLVNLVRASAAAPHYFDPELIEIVEGEPPGLFVDGALTPHNNPALQLFLTVALPAFGLNWALSPKDLSIVSIGTGTYRPNFPADRARHASALGLAVAGLTAQIAENQQLVLTLMSWLGQTNQKWVINSEVGDLGPVSPPFGSLFRFQRYDVVLEQAWLRAHCGVAVGQERLAQLRHLDDATNVPELFALANAAAIGQVRASDWTS